MLHSVCLSAKLDRTLCQRREYICAIDRTFDAYLTRSFRLKTSDHTIRGSRSGNFFKFVRFRSQTFYDRTVFDLYLFDLGKYY